MSSTFRGMLDRANDPQEEVVRVRDGAAPAWSRDYSAVVGVAESDPRAGAESLDVWRARAGPRYQSRMNAVLRSYMTHVRRRHRRRG